MPPGPICMATGIAGKPSGASGRFCCSSFTRGGRREPARMNPQAASSARAKPPRGRGKRMKKEVFRRLTREQRAELKALAALPDHAIDTSDAPELPDWSGARRGAFYRPVKQQLTLRLDADVV